MQQEHLYSVYIAASRSRTLYIGVTNNLIRRMEQHRARRPGSFTARYNITRLVFFERFGRIEDAISREKTLKGWLRSRKIALIEQQNPTWEDLLPPTHPVILSKAKDPLPHHNPHTPPTPCHPERSEGPASLPQST